MTDVITKVAIGGVEYQFAGGGSSGEEHEFITQADYDNLTPAQKAEKVYMITGEGTPGGGGSASDSFARFINNEPLATYTQSGDLLESDLPEGATFFTVVYNASNDTTSISPMILPIKFVKDVGYSGAKGFWSSHYGANISYNSSTSTFTFTFDTQGGQVHGMAVNIF